MDIDSDNEQDYSIDREDEMGSVNDWMNDLGGVHPLHWWGIGEGCAAGAIDEWGPEAEGNCDDDMDTEGDLAVDYSRMLDGVLKRLYDIQFLVVCLLRYSLSGFLRYCFLLTNTMTLVTSLFAWPAHVKRRSLYLLQYFHL